MAQTPITYYQGDLLQNTISLRVNTSTGQQNPYPIPVGSNVSILFPAASGGSIPISSLVAVPGEFGGGFEVTVTNADDGDLAFTLVPNKGIGLKLSSPITAGLPVDIIIYDSSAAQLQTFEIIKGIIVLQRANT